MNELSIMNTLFGDDGLGLGFPQLSVAVDSMPAVDVKQTKENYVLDMDLPGRTENDISLDVENKILTIKTQQDEKETKEAKKALKDGESYLIKERRIRNFTRRFTLPEDANEEGINASFKNGVLTICVPRLSPKAARKIAITA